MKQIYYLSIVCVYLMTCSLSLDAQDVAGKLLATVEDQKYNQIKGAGKTLDDKPHGAWVYFFNKSYVKYQDGHYENGKKVGTWKTYASNVERVIAVGAWEDGLLKDWRWVNMNGVTKIHIKAEKGISPAAAQKIEIIANAIIPTRTKEKQAALFNRDANIEKGSLELFGDVLKEHNITAEVRYWNYNNRLGEERFYGNQQEKLRFQYQYAFGEISKKHIWENEIQLQTIVYDIKNKNHLRIFEYHENGRKKLDYNKDKETGRFGFIIAYHPNGQKHYQGYYKENQPTGKWKYWDEKGNRVKNK